MLLKTRGMQRLIPLTGSELHAALLATLVEEEDEDDPAEEELVEEDIMFVFGLVKCYILCKITTSLVPYFYFNFLKK
jgi:hypothetical protein